MLTSVLANGWTLAAWRYVNTAGYGGVQPFDFGGMGARSKNFYHELATRYGYGEQADRIQDLYLAGRKDEATAVFRQARDLDPGSSVGLLTVEALKSLETR